MFKKILRFRTALMFSLGLSLFCPGVFAQVVHDRGQRAWHGNRHYYHNGHWNRNGWYGWGVPAPVLSDGVLVASLPPGSTAVVINGNTYFYGNDMYFKQISGGGFAVVTLR